LGGAFRGWDRVLETSDVVDPEKVRALVELMSEHDISEICWRGAEEEIQLKRPSAIPPSPAAAPVAMSPVSAAPPLPAQPAPHVVRPATVEPPAAPAADAGLVAIKSPMVGTYYASPDPNSPAFVSVGSKVLPNTVVCIVEAMKVFNEIVAEVSGTIREVLVKNESPVEFGQPLFMVKPD
jgi:acetyl-CoA carboxylase biotin carboxyl carrier protein